MNHIIILGNITNDLELRATSTGTSIVSFNLAVRRDKDNTDFIPCSAFGKTAELIHRYCNKGSKLAVIGSLRQSSYTDKEGKKKSSLNVLVNTVQLLDKKEKLPTNQTGQEVTQNDPFEEMSKIVSPDNIEITDSDLPF